MYYEERTRIRKVRKDLITFLFFFYFRIVGTIAPAREKVAKAFPWLPSWLDLNVVVPVGATVIVIIVGVIVICVAISRRARGPEQTRLRGKVRKNTQKEKKKSLTYLDS